MQSRYLEFQRAIDDKNQEEIVRLVRNYPGIHDYVGDDGNLVSIVESGAPEFLETVFAAGLSPDSGQDDCCSTFLQGAVADGDLKKLRLAIRYGANLDKRNHSGETALGYACSWGQLEAVKVLVEAGADVNAIELDPNDGFMCTALDCCSKNPEIAAFLRSKGAVTHIELSKGSA